MGTDTFQVTARQSRYEVARALAISQRLWRTRGIENIMSHWNQPIARDEILHLWPWEVEDVSVAEFERSLHGLYHFLARVDVYELRTLEDLSAVASLVGHDLHTVTVAKGRKLEQKTELVGSWAGESIPAPGRTFEFTRMLLEQEISVKTSAGFASISEKSRIGLQGFLREDLRIRLPADQDIAFGNTPCVNERGSYALDVREGHLKECYPVREPSNPEIQQAFAAVLKDAVRDVIALIPS